MSEVKHRRRAPHRVRQGRRPPHPPGRQGARRPLRPRHRPACTSRCRATSCMLALKHRQRAAHASTSTASDELALPEGRPARPDQGHPRARRPARSSRRGEKVTVEVPVHVDGDAGPRHPARPASSNTLLGRGRGHAHPDRPSRSTSRACTAGDADPRQGHRAARGRHAGDRPRRARPPRHRRADRRAARGRARRGRGRGRQPAPRPPPPSCRGRGSPPERARRSGVGAAVAGTPTRGADADGRRRAWLVVGLGNPGPSTPANRHNVGFMVLDLLAERIGGRVQGATRRRRRGRRGPARPAGAAVVLAKPMSYMNLSGGPVDALRDFYKVPAGAASSSSTTSWTSLRRAAAQARRRRQRPQRAAVDHAGRSGTGDYLPGAVRHRPPAGPDGPRRLRAEGLRGGRAQGARLPRRPGGGRRGGAGHRGAGAGAERLQLLTRLWRYRRTEAYNCGPPAGLTGRLSATGRPAA